MALSKRKKEDKSSSPTSCCMGEVIQIWRSSVDTGSTQLKKKNRGGGPPQPDVSETGCYYMYSIYINN